MSASDPAARGDGGVGAVPPALTAREATAALLKQWARALRVHQWPKNVVIFVPLIVGHAFEELSNVTAVSCGFVLLCLLSAGSYIVNDLADLDADRKHLTKRERPFASGRLPIMAGLIAAPLLTLSSVLVASLLSSGFALTLVGYLVLTTLYSFYLKQVPLLDVFVIGTLFTSRVVMGAAVISIAQSPWLLAFAMFFFFSLALAKRHVEIMRTHARGESAVLGRGYRAEDWPLTLVFGIAAGLTSIVIMLLYMTNDAAPSGLYSQPGWLYVAPAAVTVWLLRVWLLSHRMMLDDDPVVFALKDKFSWLLGLIVAAAIALAL